MRRTFLLTILCASLALAGCTGGDDGTPPTTGTPTATTPGIQFPPLNVTPTSATPPTATTPAPGANDTTPAYVPYDLAVSGIPQAVEAGQNFTFVLRATGGAPATSDHIGAHYGNASAPDAPANTTTYARACQHVDVATPVPGTYNVTCSVPSAGTWYFRGHVRAGPGNDSWGNETPLTVRPAWTATGNYTLNLTGVPTVARAGENVTMNLTIAGPTGLSSHYGAHFGGNSTGTPAIPAYPNACMHQDSPTNVPPGAPFVVTCTFPAPGTYYVRGHMFITEGLPLASSGNHYWSGEHAILVL